MITADMIPNEVVWKLHNKLWGSAQFSVEEGRAAIAAALNAWPDMDIANDDDWCSIRKGWITLPQKDTDQ